MNQTWHFKVLNNSGEKKLLESRNVTLDHSSVFFYGMRLAERFRLAPEPVQIHYQEKGTKEWKQIR